ncbi:MAG: hypothetical protein AABZ63_04420, partial [Actinomycetota bacterium]
SANNGLSSPRILGSDATSMTGRDRPSGICEPHHFSPEAPASVTRIGFAPFGSDGEGRPSSSSAIIWNRVTYPPTI